MKLDSTQAVYVAQLKDLFSVEKQLVAALEKLEEAATDENLKKGFAAHREQTQEQAKRLQEVFDRAEASPGRRKCKGMAAIIEEAEEVIASKGEGASKDAALIAAAQRTEHYEIAVYGTAVALATQLGNTEDQAALQKSLEEEKEMDRKLSSLAMGEVNPSASSETTTGQGSDAQSNQSKGSGSMAPRNGYDNDDDRGSRSRGGDVVDSAGRHYTRESWERAQEGRSMGGQHSQGGRGGSDDDRGSRSGGSRGSSRSSSYDYDDDRGSSSGGRGSSRSSSYDDDRESSSSRGSNRSRGNDDDDRGSRGGYTDSAGRQYTRESWERAQEGRSLGRQHSQGGRGNSNDDDDRGYSSSSRGSSRSSSYDDDYDDRDSRSRSRGSSSSSRSYDDNDGRGSSEGRSRGGRHSSEMQERDEFGQFAGYGNGGGGDGRSRSSSDDGNSRGSSRRSSSDDDDRGSSDGRSRGGQRSSQMQERDEYGQFAGSRSGGGGSRGYDDDDDDRGSRRSSRR